MRSDQRKISSGSAMRQSISQPAAHSERFLMLLGALFAVEFVALGVAPKYRNDWALENVLVIVGVAALICLRRRLLLSNASYALLFLFLSLHEIGAHFTYSEVPYDDWFRSWTGRSLDTALGWERNNFDRVIHFAFSLLLALPVREVIERFSGARGIWITAVAMSFLISFSMLYELIEWGAAALFGGELGMAYLGTQGDIWDAHKDMALANLGALIGLSLVANLRSE